MTNEFQVVFHNIDQSPALADNVSKRIQKLRRFSNDIIGGRVVLDSPHNNHHKGKVFSVAIEIHTASREVIVKQVQHDKPAHEDIYVAVRDAFNAAERQLKAIDKKHRKATLAVENFDVVPEASAESGEDSLFVDEEEPDLALYLYEETSESQGHSSRAA